MNAYTLSFRSTTSQVSLLLSHANWFDFKIFSFLYFVCVCKQNKCNLTIFNISPKRKQRVILFQKKWWSVRNPILGLVYGIQLMLFLNYSSTVKLSNIWFRRTVPYRTVFLIVYNFVYKHSVYFLVVDN